MSKHLETMLRSEAQRQRDRAQVFELSRTGHEETGAMALELCRSIDDAALRVANAINRHGSEIAKLRAAIEGRRENDEPQPIQDHGEDTNERRPRRAHG